MPTYQYRCRECDEELEVVQSFTDGALTKCPACKGSLRKVFAAPGISFKGSGFYKNDSRGATKSTSDSTSGSGDASSAAKADTLPEAKADKKPSADSAKPSEKKDRSSPAKSGAKT